MAKITVKAEEKNVEKITVKESKIGDLQPNWWAVKPDMMYRNIWETVTNIDQNKLRRRLNIRNASLYLSSSRRGIEYMGGVTRDFGNVPSFKSDIRYNVIKSNIDTAVSKLSKNKPMVLFLTDGGNWESRIKSQNLTKYMFGSFSDMDLYKKGRKILRDACIFGDGVVKFYKDYENKKISCERVLIDEIYCDKNDAMYGAPRSLYQKRFVQKSKLLEMYPKYKVQIEAAPSLETTENESNTEMVPILEAWHLRDTEKSNNGFHVISIETCTLMSEFYKKDYFPFAIFKWSDPITGFYGTGIPDQIASIQREIDTILRNISRALDRVGKPRVWLPNDSKVAKSRITDVIADIVNFEGGPGAKPIFETPTAMNPETYRHLQWLIDGSFKETGVNQLSAAGQKPAGVDSAVALRTMQDIESERFLDVAASYEDFYMDSATIVLDLSKDLDSEIEGGLNVKLTDAPGQNRSDSMMVLKFSECDLEEDRFIMQKWPISILPKKPEGRLQKIQEFIQSGFIDPVTGQRLLNDPDLEAYESKEFAAKNLIDKILYNMLYKSKYTSPEPEFDLKYALQSAQKQYNYGKLYRAPEKNLMLILRFMDEVQRLLAPPALPEPIQAVPATPLAVPEPQPTSELLPNIPMAQ